jgi:protein-S-isoprenylcysteine O-methyltransferase Ste14
MSDYLRGQNIRHPMYAAIFLGVIGLFINHFSWLKIFLFLTLIIVLTIKLLWEEKMLGIKFASYLTYKKQTKRIIPYII